VSPFSSPAKTSVAVGHTQSCESCDFGALNSWKLDRLSMAPIATTPLHSSHACDSIGTEPLAAARTPTRRPTQTPASEHDLTDKCSHQAGRRRESIGYRCDCPTYSINGRCAGWRGFPVVGDSAYRLRIRRRVANRRRRRPVQTSAINNAAGSTRRRSDWSRNLNLRYSVVMSLRAPARASRQSPDLVPGQSNPLNRSQTHRDTMTRLWP
jgi:hypothetical protein